MKETQAQRYTKVREILRRTVLEQPLEEMAVETGILPEKIKEIQRSPLFKDMLRDMQDRLDTIVGVDVARRIRGYAPEALDTIYSTMKQSKEEKLRFTSAQDILDRAGFSKAETIRVEKLPRFDDDDVAAITRALKSSLSDGG